MSDRKIPGDDEKTIVEVAIDNTKVERGASGEVEGYDVRVQVYVGNESWRLKATVLGGSSYINDYKSRGDAYRAFEFLVDEHGLTEER